MPLKIAVVGIGKVAREEYIPFLATQRDVALGYFNRTQASAQAAADRFGGEVFASLAEVARWQPTAAMVLTSETARYEIGTELIQLGLPRVFFEKPLVAAGGQAHVTEADFHNGKKMLNLAAGRHCQTAMVFNYRFFDQTMAAKSIAAARGFGPVIHVVGLVHFACWSHCIDLIHWFAGDIAEIAALGGRVLRSSPEIHVQANDVAAALRMSGGAAGTLIGSAGMKWQQPLYELIFTFELGRIHMRDLDGTLEILDGRTQVHESISLVRDTSRWDQYRASFGKAVGAYLQSLRDNRPPPVPGIDGLRELQVEASLARSIAQRRPVLVQDEFPLDVT